MRRLQAADAGGVDEAEPGLEQAVGEPDLDRAQAAPPVRVGGLGDEVREPVDVDGLLDGAGLGVRAVSAAGRSAGSR